jgi:superfamily II DNA helicase RecQ
MAALKTRINMPSIIYIVYLEVPYNIINYVQEAGRAGRARERITTMIVIEDKD